MQPPTDRDHILTFAFVATFTATLAYFLWDGPEAHFRAAIAVFIMGSGTYLRWLWRNRQGGA